MGAVLWAGTALALGVIFHREIDRMLMLMQAAGTQAVAVVGALALAILAVIAWRVRDRLGRLGRSLLCALRGRSCGCGC
jgi:membrane protein DedA with SNARE-associated domain